MTIANAFCTFVRKTSNGEGGRFHSRRIVSARWIHDALTPKVSIAGSDPYADGYGYFWYAKTLTIGGKPIAGSFASGNGGNKIYVVPSRHLVVAITSSAYGHVYGQRRSEAILTALLAADGEDRAEFERADI